MIPEVPIRLEGESGVLACVQRVLNRKGLVDSDYSRRLEHDVPSMLQEAAIIAGLR